MKINLSPEYIKLNVFVILMLIALAGYQQNLYAGVLSLNRFVGAELSAGIEGPGKLKISLQVFYDKSNEQIPETESVSVFESEIRRTAGIVALKKVSESVYNKYAPVGNSPSSIPSVKSVKYQGMIDLSLFHTSYDITWAYAGIHEIFNNVELAQNDAIVLNAHISNPITDTLNHIPMLDHLPMVQISSNANSGYQVAAIDKDTADKVMISFLPAFVFQSSSLPVQAQGSLLTERPPFKLIPYKSGYSSDNPLSKAISYDVSSHEIRSDHLPFGTYLMVMGISGYRQEKLLDQHQAVFIIKSIQ